jgi:hypothetical protein
MEKLILSEKKIALFRGQKNAFRHKFIIGAGEIVVHLSNFDATEMKFFNMHIEEVDAEGNSIPPLPEHVMEKNVDAKKDMPGQTTNAGAINQYEKIE